MTENNYFESAAEYEDYLDSADYKEYLNRKHGFHMIADSEFDEDGYPHGPADD